MVGFWAHLPQAQKGSRCLANERGRAAGSIVTIPRSPGGSSHDPSRDPGKPQSHTEETRPLIIRSIPETQTTQVLIPVWSLSRDASLDVSFLLPGPQVPHLLPKVTVQSQESGDSMQEQTTKAFCQQTETRLQEGLSLRALGQIPQLCCTLTVQLSEKSLPFSMPWYPAL